MRLALRHNIRDATVARRKGWRWRKKITTHGAFGSSCCGRLIHSLSKEVRESAMVVQALNNARLVSTTFE